MKDMPRSSFRIRLWLGFGLMGVAIVLLGGMGLRSIGQLWHANEWGHHASARLSATHEVGSEARIWIATLEGVTSGAELPPEQLQGAHHSVDLAIDAFEAATLDEADARPVSPGEAELHKEKTP